MLLALSSLELCGLLAEWQIFVGLVVEGDAHEAQPDSVEASNSTIGVRRRPHTQRTMGAGASATYASNEAAIEAGVPKEQVEKHDKIKATVDTYLAAFAAHDAAGVGALFASETALGNNTMGAPTVMPTRMLLTNRPSYPDSSCAVASTDCKFAAPGFFLHTGEESLSVYSKVAL